VSTGALGSQVEAVALERDGALAVGLEQRLPLDLSVSIPSIERLYEDSKADRWDPEVDVDWVALGAAVSDPAVRAAAASVWSHRAWVEFNGIPESEAALVRICIERRREADAKFFLASRGREQALIAEASVLAADAFGSYQASPPEAYLPILRDGVARRALDARVSIDAFLIAHFAVSGSIDLAVWLAARDHATVAAARVLVDAIVANKQRQVAFGWAYASVVGDRLDDQTRATIDKNLVDVVCEELSGKRSAALTSGDAFAEVRAAHELASTAGVGVAPNREVVARVRTALAETARRLRRWDLGAPLESIANELESAG